MLEILYSFTSFHASVVPSLCTSEMLGGDKFPTFYFVFEQEEVPVLTSREATTGRLEGGWSRDTP